MTSRERLLTVDEVWEEVAKVAEDLYCRYLDLNQLSLSTIHDTSLREEAERNWDVPTGIEVTGESHDADLVGTA